MSDSLLNQFLASGTAAERAAFTPNPQTPAVGPDPTYIWLETDTGDTFAWDTGGSVWVQISSSGSGDVVGPASSVDNHVAIFDSTTGKLLKDGGVALLANGANITPAAAPATTAVGYLGSPIDTSLDSGNAAPGLTDGGKTYYHTDANTRTFTIPANASVAIAIGTIFAGEQGPTAGNLTIAITTDTLRWGSSTGSRTVAANGGWSVQKLSSTVWRLRGEEIT